MCCYKLRQSINQLGEGSNPCLDTHYFILFIFITLLISGGGWIMNNLANILTPIFINVISATISDVLKSGWPA